MSSERSTAFHGANSRWGGEAFTAHCHDATRTLREQERDRMFRRVMCKDRDRRREGSIDRLMDRYINRDGMRKIDRKIDR